MKTTRFMLLGPQDGAIEGMEPLNSLVGGHWVEGGMGMAHLGEDWVLWNWVSCYKSRMLCKEQMLFLTVASFSVLPRDISLLPTVLHIPALVMRPSPEPNRF